jgi:hypothetical protein
MGNLIVHAVVVYLVICLMANYKRVKRNYDLTIKEGLSILNPRYTDEDSLEITGVLTGMALLFLGAIEYIVMEMI